MNGRMSGPHHILRVNNDEYGSVGACLPWVLGALIYLLFRKCLPRAGKRLVTAGSRLPVLISGQCNPVSEPTAGRPLWLQN